MSASTTDIVRRESLSELRQLAGWFRVNHGLQITLLGGWAVYSYNPYLGSLDIDCLGPADPFTLQLNIYMNSNGYVLEPDSDHGAASESWKKPVIHEELRIGEIHIDACDYGFRNVFKENPEKMIPYDLCINSEFIERRTIEGDYVYVPVKELLFLYKTKAARDRDYVLKHEVMPIPLLERQQGKIEKDYSDLAALLDPRYGGAMDGFALGDLIRKYDLAFIVDTISHLTDQQGSADYWSRRSTSKLELSRWTDKILQDSGFA
jgi:hypothetical protein